MHQKSNDIVDQVNYEGRWVDRKTFRAFVYSKTEEKLANNFEEYEFLLASGLWFATKDLTKSTKLVVESEGKKKTELKDDKKPVSLNEFKSNKPTGK